MSNIEQADRIVGITEAIAACRNYGLSRDVYRRGAYVEWLSELKPDVNPAGFDLPRSIEEVANAVIKYHALTQPKGDGLPSPDDVRTYGRDYCDDPSCRIVCDDEDQLNRTAEYVKRCLSAPVRRFLAAFDVVDERPTDRGTFAFGIENGTPLIGGAPPDARCPIAESDVVCWLVPKGNK